MDFQTASLFSLHAQGRDGPGGQPIEIMGLLVGKVAFPLFSSTIHLASVLSPSSSLSYDSIPLTSQFSMLTLSVSASSIANSLVNLAGW
jgi:hypothetical protein